MAYNASLANFLESQGIPYMGSPVMDAGIASLQTPSYSMPVFDPYTLTSMDASQAKKDAMVKGQLEAIENKGKLGVPGFSETPVKQFLTPNPPGTPPPTYTNLINQAYGSVGITSPDQPGAQYWASQLQSGAIRPEDFQRSFLTAATGVTDPTYAANVAKAQELLGGLNTQAVTKAYQDVLGRAGDTAGIDYFTQQLASGALKPQDLASTLAQAAIPVATTLEDRLALQKYLGKDIYAPAEFLRGTSGYGYQDIVDYINANVQDPVMIAQAAAQYGIDPAEILAAKKAVGEKDIPTLKAIEDYLAQGRAGFEPRFQEIVGSVFGTGEELTSVKENLYDQVINYIDSLNIPASKKEELKAAQTPDSVFSQLIDSKDYTGKSLENILTTLQQGSINKAQEAGRVAGIAKNLYGLSDTEIESLQKNLVSGSATDSIFKEAYEALLRGNLSSDLEFKLLKDAAEKNPNSPYFLNNPDKLLIAKPIGRIQNVGENSNQYGIDLKTGLPFVNFEAVQNTLGGNVFVRPFNEERGQGALGYNPHSKYKGLIATGAGLFNVTATNQDVKFFDDIEKKIAKAGGIRTLMTEDGIPYDVISVEKTDENGKKYLDDRQVITLFDVESEEASPSTSYQNYLQNREALQKAAAENGIQYKSFKQAYDDLNKKFENTYIIQGRTDTLDPAAAKILGIPDVKDNSKHATILYKRFGDKLVPDQVLKVFDFKDPNTSRGFFGDILGAAGQLLSIPPIALAFSAAGGFPALFQGTLGTSAAAGASSALANTIGSSVLDNTGIGALLANTGLSYSQLGGIESLLGRALLQGGTSALTTGMLTGSLDKSLTSGLAGLVGSAVSGGTQIGLGQGSPFNFANELNLSPAAVRAASEVLGGSAARSVTGQDPGQYAINRIMGLGLGALANMGAEKAGIPTKGPGAEVFKAMLPIITTRNVQVDDVMRLAKALGSAGYLSNATATA